MSTQGAAHRGPLAWLRNAPIRRKLAIIIVIPLTTVTVLAALRLADNIQEANSATKLGGLVGLSRASATLVCDLQRERTAAARYMTRDGVSARGLTAAAKTTDRAAKRYQRRSYDLGDVPEVIATDLRAVDRDLDTLTRLRGQVRDRSTAGSAMALRYEVVVDALNGYRLDVAQYAGGWSGAGAIRAAALFSQAKADVSYAGATAYLGLSSGRFGADEREGFLSTLHSQEQDLLAFLGTASNAQRTMVTGTVAGDAVELADGLVTELSRGDTNLPADDVRRALGAEADLMRWVERGLDDHVVAGVAGYRDDIVRRAGIASLLAVLTIVLALLVTVLLARMMSLSLRRLGRAADRVARQDLPRAMARMRTTGHVDGQTLPALISGAYDPIPVTSTDEVGQVARSFNGVHREAIRIAVEQAVQRINASATFVGIARRSQKLVDKMIARLDEVERDELQPDRLSALFELDHLATRMRRNDENLLILADSDAASPRLEDAPLADVLAAAQSEVARYERIEIGPLDRDTGEGEAILIRAGAVNDVVRLFAELLENAAAFSPPSRPVRVSARQVGGQALVEIEDHGIGMTQQRRDEANEQLADPTSRHVDSVRMMGFAVVAKLAGRHKIRVHLGAGRTTGVVVHVMLPDGLVLITRHRSAPEPLRLPTRGVGPGRGAGHGRPRMSAPSLGVPPAPVPAARAAAAPGPPERRPQPYPAAPAPAAPAPAMPSPAAAPPAARSDWFDSPTARTADGEPEPPATGRHSADRGWAIAERAATPATAGRTTNGLPKRAPMAQLVPGGFDREPAEIARNATGVRTVLTEYQRGVSTGRGRKEPHPSTVDRHNHGES